MAVTATQRQIWMWSRTPCDLVKEDSRRSIIQILLCLLEMHNHQDAGLTMGLLLYWLLLPKLSAKILLGKFDRTNFCCCSVCLALSSYNEYSLELGTLVR